MFNQLDSHTARFKNLLGRRGFLAVVCVARRAMYLLRRGRMTPCCAGGFQDGAERDGNLLALYQRGEAASARLALSWRMPGAARHGIRAFISNAAGAGGSDNRGEACEIGERGRMAMKREAVTSARGRPDLPAISATVWMNR